MQEKVYVIYDREDDDRLFSHEFYETEEDAEGAVSKLKEYGYNLYVMELNKSYNPMTKNIAETLRKES